MPIWGPPPSGGGSAAELAATTDYVDTQPTSPTTGIKLFSRNRARRVPSFVGPTGQDSRIQPSLFSNRSLLWMANNNTTTGNGWGFSVTTSSGGATTATQVAAASTNFYTSMTRLRFATTATAGSTATLRNGNAQWFLSSTPNMGGFYMVMRFGINAWQNSSRLFFGFNASTATMTNVDPSTLQNIIGFVVDSGATNFRFVNNGTGTAGQVNLGTNFVTNTNATNFYEASIFAPSGGGSNVYWSMQRLNDGVVTGGNTTASLPALGTLLNWHAWMSNGTTAAIASFDLQSVYVETDN